MCSRGTHEEIKHDALLWDALTAPLNGAQDRVVWDLGDAWVELANCRACNSTLARPITITLAPSSPPARQATLK